MKKKITLVELLVIVAIVALAFSCLVPELPSPFIIIGYLVGGWVGFIGRISGQMHWRWEVIISVAIYASILVVGGHYFARWLYREMRGLSNDPAIPGRWKWSWTMRLFALFVLMFAAGTSAVAIVHQTAWIATAPEPMFSRGGERSNRVRCSSNLRQIGMGIELYANDHQGKYPDDIQELIVKADIHPEVLICPSSIHEKATGATIAEAAENARKDLHYSYIYLGKGLVKPVNPELVIAYERPGNHDSDGMNVLFGDGHCEWFNEPSMRKLLAQIEAAGGKASVFENK
jgi:prepilin-type processing-associated H-X9-DG protein